MQLALRVRLVPRVQLALPVQLARKVRLAPLVLPAPMVLMAHQLVLRAVSLTQPLYRVAWAQAMLAMAILRKMTDICMCGAVPHGMMLVKYVVLPAHKAPLVLLVQLAQLVQPE